MGNSAEQTTAGSPEFLPHYEKDLPTSLLHALEEYKRSCGKMCPASIACEESSTAASTPANGPVDHQAGSRIPEGEIPVSADS